MITKICQNNEDWVIAEPTPTPAPAPTPTPRKRGVIELDNEGMREAKRNLKEKRIKAEDVKHLPPIEDLCKSTLPPSVKVNSLQYLMLVMFLMVSLLINAWMNLIILL